VQRVLVLNAGSATLKASVIEGPSNELLARAGVDVAGGTAPAFAAAVRGLLAELAKAGADPTSVGAVGHRVVHGGARFTGAVQVDDAVVAAIEALGDLAPLHNAAAARVIAAARAILPSIPHVAVFDTAFHASLDAPAYVYALPRAWHEEWGYRRFGFHGLSVEWSTGRAGELLGRDPRELGLVVAHLGAGCSVTAVWQGRSASTSMGMTPLEGLVMATRSGSVDPGLLLAAQREHGLDAAALVEVLDRRSGLLGISGTSGDVRELLVAAPRDERAALAIEIFVRSAAAGIAAAATALPRLDAIVFTGGIGEHAATVRASIAGRLASIGVPAVSSEPVAEDAVLARGPVAVLRVEAREDVVIAQAVRRLLPGHAAGQAERL